MGCNLKVEIEDDKVVSVSGNTCKRGISYAEAEAVHPLRMLTTTMLVEGGAMPVVPARTQEPVPKECMMEYMNYINACTVQAPVKRDQELCTLPGCGVKIIATADVAEA